MVLMLVYFLGLRENNQRGKRNLGQLLLRFLEVLPGVEGVMLWL